VRRTKLAVMAAIVVAVTAACAGGDDQSAEEIAAADRALLVGNSPVALAVGEGGVWVVDDKEKSLRRFTITPPRSLGEPLRLPGTPVDVTAGLGGVFAVTRGPSRIVRIDPDTGAVTNSAALPGEPVSVDAGDREVWVATRKPDALVRVDRRTGAVVEKGFPLPFEPSFVSARDLAVWVGSEKAKRVARIDQRTGAVRRSFRVPNGLEDIATGDGGTLWFAQGDDHPYGHVPIEGDYVELDDPEATDGSFRVAVGPRGGVYVIASEDSRSTSGTGSSSSRTYYIREGLVVDPRTGNLRSDFEVSDDVRDIAAGAGAVWTIEPATGNVPPGSWRISRHPIEN
jgi:streptogramin lyase